VISRTILLNVSPPLVRVLAAVCTRDAHFLIAKRPLHKRHGGLWEFPGGKFEPGESPFDAARRELAEELDVAVTSVGKCLFTVQDEGSPFVIEFYPVSFTGEPTALEHAEWRWATLEEMVALPLAPSDARLVDYLRQSPLSGARRDALPLPDGQS
jgi:8-oxo-dGTP diphosphatase